MLVENRNFKRGGEVMVKYCAKCKELHEENEMCPKYKAQLKEHPEWLEEAANFTVVAGQYKLITSQALDGVAQAVNKVAGTNLSYEGTNQFMRDIQVFSKLNSDAFSKCGKFANAETAKKAFENAIDGKYLKCRLNGTGQEIDWLRQQQGKLSNIFLKSEVLEGNAPGIDGIKVNRFTGKIFERVTVKSAENSSGLGRNAEDIIRALEKGRLNPNDTVFGVEGTGDALKKALENKIENATKEGNMDFVNRLKEAQKNLKVVEKNNFNDIKNSTERLKNKILNGQAHPEVTLQEATKKVVQGAVVGAAVSLTVSSITNYIKYKNGEITKEEAFREVSEDTTQGLLVGGAMAGVSILLPGLGFIGGIAVGIYIGATCRNILDEVYGKGVYEAILDSAGYVMGTCKNAEEMMKEYSENIRKINRNIVEAKESDIRTKDTLDKVNQMLEGL